LVSASFPGLPAVEQGFADKDRIRPAKKQSACISSVMAERPADRRTRDFGIMIRASATILTNSIGPIGAASASGVPAIGISMLIGTLSGGSGRLASVHQHIDAIDFFLTHPRIPPQQTFMPD